MKTTDAKIIAITDFAFAFLLGGLGAIVCAFLVEARYSVKFWFLLGGTIAVLIAILLFIWCFRIEEKEGK